MKGPLNGVRVLDMSLVLAGPMASMYLAQLGAEVVKLEPPGGDPMRANSDDGSNTPDAFVALNAGKHSVCLDLRSKDGQAAIRELVADCDVFLESFRPGLLARYGLDEKGLRAVNPRMIYCSISGYGQRGEWAGRGAYDLVVQAATGMMMLSGDEENQAPVKVGFPVVDAAVAMLSSMAIAAALHQRQVDGKGQSIDASMVQAALALMYPVASAVMTTGVEAKRVGNRGSMGSPATDTYRCADGWLAASVNTPAQFGKLATVLGVDALCSDPRALDLDAYAGAPGALVASDLDFLRSNLWAAFATRSAAELESALNAAGVAAAKVRTIGEFLREVDDGSKIALSGLHVEQNGRVVRTPGVGFGFGFGFGFGDDTAPATLFSAEPLGDSNSRFLKASPNKE
ncbi:CaiB/BaiF CoA-transferase family protein [Pseudacidovorax sp. RU35E]|uniref:CaiB/BaiF CoA transferase family protein n=1 Tax=Pseudacidovorax sp. RU35E TaxID=1907403 RepID=UPI0009568881|nr:CoA transferase [Pseudacidovorax sp. RU35E]SIR76599.1 Crotonobetainyl-CoA:carnitine CoA-transferase CaiB [Pseudacidovorax sp. RU35E]